MSKTFQPDSLHPYIMDARLKKVTGSGGIGNIPIASADTLGVVKAGDGVSINADGAISGVAYSTTEHKTGRKWIDGKDVYEITFTFSTSTANTKTDSGVKLPDRDRVIQLDGILGNGVPVFSDIDSKVGVMIENGKLVYYVPNWAINATMYITMLYTKPTI